jgi:hypothetical protein
MKLSVFTLFTLAWLYGTIAGLLLPHGPLTLALYGLLLLALSGAAHLVNRVVAHQLALARFRQEMQVARRLAVQAVYGGSCS